MWLSWTKLSKKLKNGIKIFVGPAIQHLSKKCKNMVLIKNRLAYYTKIVMPLEFL